MAQAFTKYTESRHAHDQPTTPRRVTSGFGGRLRVFLHRIEHSDQRLQLVLLVFMLLWYGSLLGVSLRLALTDPVRLTFNSMLSHLLEGRFDVDPQTVQYEGFVHDGRTYSYFGIWCALLRFPLWIVGQMNVDVTFWSCLAAVCLAGTAKIKAVLLVRSRAITNPYAKRAIRLMLAYFLLAGSAVAYLQVSIYLEVVLWAHAFAAIFVYFALKGILNRSFGVGVLSSMAVSAGLALLTRATVGVGLILAFSFLFLVLELQPSPTKKRGQEMPFSKPHSFYTIVPVTLLGVLIVATGAVNYFRWGNPLTFANHDFYLLRSASPNFLPNLYTYGYFNVRRIPFGLMYYFLPLWVVQGSNGHLLFSGSLTRLVGFLSLPPASFLLTDLLPVGFIVLLLGLVRTRGHKSLPTRACLAIAVGLLVPCVLLLSFTWMVYRYRLDFYPEFEFLALLGLYATVTNEATLARFMHYRKAFNVSLGISIAASAMALVLFDLSNDDPDDIVRPGIVRYYSDQVTTHLHHVWVRGSILP